MVFFKPKPKKYLKKELAEEVAIEKAILKKDLGALKKEAEKERRFCAKDSVAADKLLALPTKKAVGRYGLDIIRINSQQDGALKIMIKAAESGKWRSWKKVEELYVFFWNLEKIKKEKWREFMAG